MGLFSRKKEVEKKEQPRFPQFHEEFPKYESAITQEDMSAIKEAVRPDERPPMPVKKMTFASMPLKERPRIEEEPKPYMPEMPEYDLKHAETLGMPETDLHKQDKNLFIKIERYKEAVEKADNIKAQLEEITKVMDKLNELKTEEDAEISHCHSQISAIKESIDSIDRILFGK